MTATAIGRTMGHTINLTLVESDAIGTIRDTVSRTVASLPDHDAYLARYCGAGKH